MSQNLSIQERSVSSLLKDNTNMVIPIYQRGYAWETQQVEELWSDLLEVNSDQQDYHFFGQIVMNSFEKKLYIIDGQQRLTTSIIFVALLRNKLIELYKEFDDSEAKIRAKDIQADLIGSNQSFHLTQSEDLIEYFNKNILVSNAFDNKNKPKKGSAKNVYNAYTLLERKLTAKLREFNSPTERRDYIYSLYKTFTENFFVITLVTPDEAAAFVIFETLNARGRDLNASDLLKNHILRIAKNNIETVKDDWDQMANSLGNESNKMTKFVRTYWNSDKQFVTEKALYKVIYKDITTSSEAFNLVNNLKELAPVYEALANPKNVIYFKNEQINELLVTLLDLGSKTFYPLLLALVKNKYSEADILITLHKVYAFVARNFTVSGLVANRYEKMFSNIAIKVNTLKIASIQEINQEIATEFVTDEQFMDNFRYAKIRTEKASKHILRDIFYDNEIDKIDLDKVKVIVLNKNIEDQNLIGNKLLVTKKEYSKMNDSVDFLEVLKHSKFEYTRKMAENSTISEQEIEAIQANKAEFAANYWK